MSLSSRSAQRLVEQISAAVPPSFPKRDYTGGRATDGCESLVIFRPGLDGDPDLVSHPAIVGRQANLPSAKLHLISQLDRTQQINEMFATRDSDPAAAPPSLYQK